MSWGAALEWATKVSGILSLLSFFGVLFAFVATRRKEASVFETISGSGIPKPKDFIDVLGKFPPGPDRLEALRLLLHWETSSVEAVLQKVEADTSPERLEVIRGRRQRRTLLICGFVFLGLALVGLAGSGYSQPSRLVDEVSWATHLGDRELFDAFKKRQQEYLDKYSRDPEGPRIGLCRSFFFATPKSKSSYYRVRLTRCDVRDQQGRRFAYPAAVTGRVEKKERLFASLRNGEFRDLTADWLKSKDGSIILDASMDSIIHRSHGFADVQGPSDLTGLGLARRYEVRQILWTAIFPPDSPEDVLRLGTWCRLVGGNETAEMPLYAKPSTVAPGDVIERPDMAALKFDVQEDEEGTRAVVKWLESAQRAKAFVFDVQQPGERPWWMVYGLQ